MSPDKVSTTKKLETKICAPLLAEDLPDTIFPRKLSDQAFSVWVRQLLFNARQGTVHSKTRSEVSRSGKKPWKQKGTGRARAGDAGSPVWRGGGIAFGPQARVRTLDVPQKVKRGVLNTLLYDFVTEQKILVADWVFSHDKPKTKEAYKLLKNSGMQNQVVVMFVAPNDFFVQASFANISNIRLVLYDAPNAYDLVLGKSWLILKKDLNLFTEMVEKWR